MKRVVTCNFVYVEAHTGEIAAGVAGGLMLILMVVLLALYRNWRYELELDSLLWKVDYRDIQMNEDQQPLNGATLSSKITRVTTECFRNSYTINRRKLYMNASYRV
jgi:atrial natriuretic peptide receptor A